MNSKYILLAKLKARYDLEYKSYEVGRIIKHKYERERELRKRLFLQYNYIPEKHQALFSPHSISRNEGCGCEYCTRLHAYASAKLNLHYFKRTFNADFGLDTLLMHKETSIPLHSNFYALYSEHTTKITKGKPLSQLKFYEAEVKRRTETIKKLRASYRSSKEAIAMILSS